MLKGSALDALGWVQEALSATKSLDRKFGWHLLAEAAALRAVTASPRDIVWARVATSVYDRLAAEAEGANRDSFAMSSMMLRGSMIRALGAIAGDSVQDPDRIRDWFYMNQDLPFEDVERMVENWKACDVGDIAKLRKIKNRLGVIALLEEAGALPDPEIKRWLTLRTRLP